MLHKELLFTLVVLVSVIVGLLAGILEFAEGGRPLGAVKSGGVAFGVALGLGVATVTWMVTS